MLPNRPSPEGSSSRAHTPGPEDANCSENGLSPRRLGAVGRLKGSGECDRMIVASARERHEGLPCGRHGGGGGKQWFGKTHEEAESPDPGDRGVCEDNFCFSTWCDWEVQGREVASEQLRASRWKRPEVGYMGRRLGKSPRASPSRADGTVWASVPGDPASEGRASQGPGCSGCGRASLWAPTRLSSVVRRKASLTVAVWVPPCLILCRPWSGSLGLCPM